MIFPSTTAEARTLRVLRTVVLPPVEPIVNVVAFVARFTVFVWSPSNRFTILV